MPLLVAILMMVIFNIGSDVGGCAQRQKTYDFGCEATCKHAKSTKHSADKHLCVCDNGKTFKYDINTLYHE